MWARQRKGEFLKRTNGFACPKVQNGEKHCKDLGKPQRTLDKGLQGLQEMKGRSYVNDLQTSFKIFKMKHRRTDNSFSA